MRRRRRLAGAALLALAVGASTGCTVRPRAAAEASEVGDAPASASDVPVLTELDNTFESPFALGDAVLDAIAAEDADALERHALTEPEFVHIIWPELPSSRPERGVPVEYAWGDLYMKSRDSILGTLRRHGGKRYALMRVEFEGETTEYASFRVHRDARLRVRGEDGRIVQIDVFGSVIERRGRYKAFSMFVD